MAIVHRFLELKTQSPLADDYRFHALPDACTYVVFDQSDPTIAGVTRLKASSEELNLGKTFHFINIRFLPGVWQRDREEVSYGVVKEAYSGGLPLRAVNKELIGHDFAAQQIILSRFVESLVESKLVIANPVTEKIFQDRKSVV